MSQKTAARHFISRLNFVTILIFLSAFGIILRLFWLQIADKERYLALAENQQNFSEVAAFDRGDIYLRQRDGGLFVLASERSGYDLYIEPKKIIDSEEVFKKLSAITDILEDVFFAAAGKKDDPFEMIKRDLTLEEWESVKLLGLPGVGVLVAERRFYPAGSLASHSAGFVSVFSDKPEGKYGVEGFYNGVLSYKQETESGEVVGSPSLRLILGEQFLRSEREKKDLVLTLEPETQLFTEKQLKGLFEKWNYLSGGIIILKPATGEIKALAAYPDFDPNKYYEVDDLRTFLNPFTQKVFEMGSVFKPLTMAAAINEGVVTPETTYVDMGFIKFGPDTIHNYDGKARGKVNMTRVLEESLNTGAVFAMQQIGGAKLKEYFYKFGLAETLGIDLPGEVAGNLRNLDSGREIEYATASFGQGLAVTPLELTMALGALANKGKLTRPYVNEELGPLELRRVITEETAFKVSRMLVEVVDVALAGGAVKIPEYSIAAKTGTAQIPKRDGPGYSEEYLHSYFGYFPAYDPEFFIFMFLERPQGIRYASQSLSGAFKEIVEFLINYYTIVPDR